MSPPNMADAPQVVPQTDYPETSYKYQHAVPEYHDKSDHTYSTSQVPGPYDEHDIRDHNRILGLRRRTFWILLVVAIVVVGGAIIGGSVGGSLAVQKSGNKSDQNNEASPSSIPANSATPTRSASSASPTSTAAVISYAPLQFANVSTIDIDCPTDVYVSGQDWGSKYRYSCEKRRSVGLGGVDILTLTAYTYQQCVDACSQWNDMSARNMTCKAIVIASDLANRRTIGNGANCWLKSSGDSDNRDMPLMLSFTLMQ